MDLDVAWGGFYAVNEGSQQPTRFFRLLDFSRESIHVAWYEPLPNPIEELEQFLAATPSVAHATFPTRELVELKSVRLIGSLPLTASQLEAYRNFLVSHQIPGELIEEHFTKLAFFSSEPPLLARLELANGELVITER